MENTSSWMHYKTNLVSSPSWVSQDVEYRTPAAQASVEAIVATGSVVVVLDEEEGRAGRRGEQGAGAGMRESGEEGRAGKRGEWGGGESGEEGRAGRRERWRRGEQGGGRVGRGRRRWSKEGDGSDEERRRRRVRGKCLL